MSDYGQKELEELVAEPIREKEEDILKRQVIKCQDTVSEEPLKFVGAVEMFEAMLDEDIENIKNMKKNIEWNPEEIAKNVFKAYNILKGDKVPTEVQYAIALQKFKVLYKIFKEGHLPITIEVKT